MFSLVRTSCVQLVATLRHEVLCCKSIPLRGCASEIVDRRIREEQ